MYTIVSVVPRNTSSTYVLCGGGGCCIPVYFILALNFLTKVGQKQISPPYETVTLWKKEDATCSSILL